jgi:hypothetical protein
MIESEARGCTSRGDLDFAVDGLQVCAHGSPAEKKLSTDL